MCKTKFIICGLACCALITAPAFAATNPCKSLTRQCNKWTNKASKTTPVDKAANNITTRQTQCERLANRFDNKIDRQNDRIVDLGIQKAEKIAACIGGIFGIGGGGQNCDKIAATFAKKIVAAEVRQGRLQTKKERAVSRCNLRIDSAIANHQRKVDKLNEAKAKRDDYCAQEASCNAG